MADYRAILDAIDAAITAGVTGPGQIRSADGRMITYRSLSELMEARRHYAGLLASQRGSLSIRKIRSGSPRG